MDLPAIVAAIDSEIAERKSDGFGVKVGGALFKALVQHGHIEKVDFSVSGTGAFNEKLPAYNGKHFVWHDWELGDDAFEVGIPA